MSEHTVLIQGARLLCLDDAGNQYEQADILVRGTRIEAIGADLRAQAPADAQVIDARGLLAMPGLINAHFHSPGNFMRGQLPGLPLELFMLYEVPPLVDSAEADHWVYLRTLVAALEMLELGITAVHDDAYHVPVASRGSIDAVMRAYRDAGIRASVAIDQPNVVEYEKFPFLEALLPAAVREEMREAPLQSSEELLALYDYLLQRWHGAEDGRLGAAVSCSAPQRVTADYLQALGALSRRHGLPFNIHVLETKLQRVLGEEKYGKSLVRYLADQNILDPLCQIIHAIWTDDADISLLAAAGCVVAHNPVCNLRLGSGVMPFRKLRDAGVPIALGSDELCTDDSVNLWFVGKTAALLHTLGSPDYRQWPTADEVLHSLTRGGARALNRTAELGQLAPGCLADIILLDMDSWSFTPLNDLARQLVYSEDGRSLRYTLVNGRLVYANGAFQGIDAGDVRRQVRELTESIRRQYHACDASAERLKPYYDAMYQQAQARDVGFSRYLGEG
ncbi:amidohydrolase family protein [Pseudomonas sp. PS02288]|uniref:amidohydrolase family protein n=1 Tax=Pseudomonas sp. PS02288 TaxID=2991443 RepID=UPI00249AF29C|nr:amidohydrolase family protein [Pseudomonas sp. PS02288]